MNVRLVLPSGESIKVEASESQLEGADYLYKAITLNVHVMEPIRSGQLREMVKMLRCVTAPFYCVKLCMINFFHDA